MTPPKTIDGFVAGGPSLREVQEGLLRDLLLRNRDTAYGRSHGFGGVGSWSDYRQLPLMTYDRVAFDGDYWSDPAHYTSERVVAYFLTSGSSSRPKRVPVTGSLIRQKAAAFAVFWDSIYTDHPVLREGRFIANFGDSGVVARNEDNVVELSETTFWNQRMQGFQKKDRWPLPRQLSSISSAEWRYYAAARLALQGRLHCIMGLNPSTLLKLAEVIQSRGPELSSGLRAGRWGVPELDGREDLPEPLTARLQSSVAAAERLDEAIEGYGAVSLPHLWPELSLILCWQSDLVSPYLDILRRYTGGVPYRDYITQSSECIIAIPDRDETSGGLLAYPSHFYEFVPEAEVESGAPATRPAWDLDEGARYEVVVTTGAGLYRYRTADCVLVTGHRNGIPILSFQHRFGRVSSMTGEKLTEAQILEALRRSGTEDVLTRREVVVFPRTGERPHYGVLVDHGLLRDGQDREAVAAWLGRFHRALCDVNGEYGDKCGSLRLGTPRALVVPSVSVAALHAQARARHVGDDQYKPSVLWRQRDLDEGMDRLLEIDARHPD